MTEQTYRDRWKREVYRTPSFSDSVRVALLALADDMDDDGMVQVKQDELAELLGKSGRRAGGRLTSAIRAGYLERVSRGQRNGKGRYRATLPGDPSSGHPGVPKKAGVFRTPGCPQEDSLQDTLGDEEKSFSRSLQDTRVSPRSSFDPSVFRTPGCPEEAAPYRGTARAHSKHGDLNHQTPQPSGTDETTLTQTATRVSQSARKREAFRWLHLRYGLTEFEAAAVFAEVTARAPEEIRAPVRYLEKMKEGDLADIVAAVFDRTKPDPGGDEKADEPEPPNGRPQWCGHCDERTRFVELIDGRPKRCPACHPLRDETRGETA